MPPRGAVPTVGLALMGLLGALAAPARPAAQFRTGTTLVAVDAAVVGPDGAVVSDLRAEDFELLVDGAPVPIQQFRFVDASLAPPEADTPVGVASNAAEPGGVFALVIDELNLGTLSGMQARRLAVDFIRNVLQPHDYAAVMRSGSTSAFLFGNDPQRLIAIARDTAARGGGSAPSIDIFAAVEKDANSGELTSAEGIDPAGVGGGGADIAGGLEMLRLAVERLAAIPSRRKAVIWFAEGLSVDVRAAMAIATGRVGAKVREVMRAAFEGNVAIYPVDPRGLFLGANVSRFVQPPASSVGLDGLRDVGRVTGGRAVINTNQLIEALGEVARENRAYYLLGYAPTGPPERQWRVQSIEVRVRRPGVTVRHRTGFVPMASPPAPALVPIAAPLPIRGLRLAMAPALVSHLSRQPSVVVPFTVLGGMPAGSDATYLVMAVDEKGRTRGQDSGRLPPGEGTPIAAAPRLSLPAGRYQVRLIVQGVGTGGTVFGDVLVPKSGASPGVCGGIHLEQADAAPASATHQFAAATTMRVHATVSAPGAFKGANVAIVLSGQEGDVQRQPAEVTAARGGWWRIEGGLTLPATAGRYRLTLQSDRGPLTGCDTELDVTARPADRD